MVQNSCQGKTERIDVPKTGKTMLMPLVEPKFERMPTGFVNDVRGWTFSEGEIKEAAERKLLLTMDLDMAGAGVCSLACGHCFRRTAEFRREKRLGSEEINALLREATALGLRSVKIIGPGEPLEDRALLPLLETLKTLGVVPLIFTKGWVLGDDSSCRKIHGMDGRDFIKTLDGFGASILLGTTSFSPGLEDKIVGMPGYHAARNEAIIRLLEAGFADFAPGKPTRLAFAIAPVTPQNIDEAFEIYVWARQRHIQPVMAPTMVAGKALDKLNALVPAPEELLELWIKLNVWAIEHGVTSLKELRTRGVSAYGGGAPCNQVGIGLFLRGDGKALRCPGDDIHIQGDVKKQGLTEIWKASENLRAYSGQANNGCPPKEGIIFAPGFFQKVLSAVEAHFGS